MVATERPTQAERAAQPSPWRERLQRTIVPIIIAMFAIAFVLAGQLLVHHARAGVNHVPESQSAAGVTVVAVAAATYVSTRVYVGRVEPWAEAFVGPQYVSAYLRTVNVRPGAIVRRADLLATLDCSESDSLLRVEQESVRQREILQHAMSDDVTRRSALLSGGFVAQNDVDQHLGESESALGQIMAARAHVGRTALATADCMIRAPFDGEVESRLLDPGTYVRPGTAVATIVDRSTVRAVADVPESDFRFVEPGSRVRIELLLTGQVFELPISRRSPSVRADTRTARIEVDIPNAARTIPTEAIVRVEVNAGRPIPAVQIPLVAAEVRGMTARLFEVDDGVAHVRTVRVLGENDGDLFVAPEISPGARVVVEGRTLLRDGDRVRSVQASPSVGQPATPVPPTLALTTRPTRLTRGVLR